MRKRDELTEGCMSRARDDEMTFVLLGRDAAAPVAIRAWIAERIKIGKNQIGDHQLTEAEECARTIELELCRCHDCRAMFDPHARTMETERARFKHVPASTAKEE